MSLFRGVGAWALLVLLAGCAAEGAGGGSPGVAAGARPLAVEAGTGSNRVQFTVDGQAFAFRTPQVRQGRAAAGEGVVAESFELASADQSLYARLVLYVAAGREDLSGDYRVALPGADGAAPGTAELLLAEETDLARGRRMFPSGDGQVQVKAVGGYFEVRFEYTGDDLFRAAEAAPVSGEMAFHAPS